MIIAGFAGIVAALVLHQTAFAAVFNGGTVQDGINNVAGIGGISSANFTTLIQNVINFILDVITIIAVLTIVIAGLYLILSLGDETQKDKAKKIIQYTIIGLIVIVLADTIVNLVFDVINGNTSTATGTVSGVIITVLLVVLDIITTIAVLMLVIAGIYLIVSMGDETQKDKAKKIVIYTVVGLLLIIFARVIIVFVSNIF